VSAVPTATHVLFVGLINEKRVEINDILVLFEYKVAHTHRFVSALKAVGRKLASIHGKDGLQGHGALEHRCFTQ
jgi:hypothetical protein